jgi:hypothetical protein
LGDRRTGFVVAIISVILLSTGIIASADAFSEKKFKSNTTKLIHLGYLQLAAHDLFNVDRTANCDDDEMESCAMDNENGKLDLSTVLFEPKAGACDYQQSLAQEGDCTLYSTTDIKNGGEIRSSENIMIATAGAEVGEKYLEYVDKFGEEEAYDKILKFYHSQLKKAYEETFHLEFPAPEDGDLTQLNNLAFRTGHDLLPARISFHDCVLPDEDGLCSIFIINPRGEKLDDQEQKQRSVPVDGTFEPEFLGINFCPVPPNFCIEVDLLEADQSFGEQFGFGAERFDSFLEDLEDGHFDEDEEVSQLLREAFAKGLNF